MDSASRKHSMSGKRLVLCVALGAALLAAALITVLRTRPAAPSQPNVSRAALLDSGRVVFGTCALCHGREGRGDRCPPLVYSDFVQGDRARLIRFVLRPEDTVRVNGVLWRGTEMPPLENLSDFEVAAVLSYIRSLNDSLIACTAENAETGTWAECRTRPRDAAEAGADFGADIATDLIRPEEVAAIRATLPAP